MIQVNRIYLIFNRLVTKKFLVDTSACKYVISGFATLLWHNSLIFIVGMLRDGFFILIA